jgi:hypothetical protein
MDAGIAKWKGYKQLRFMTLTSSKDAEYTRLNPDFEVLKKRLKTHFGSFFEYVKVKTSEGKGVIHIIYAGPFIPQTWLSRNWGEIHGSPIVDIRKLYFGRGLRNYLSSYLQGQGRLSYSWGWFKKGWASSYRRLQADKKRAYVLVGRLGLKAPLFCLRAWSRWFYRVYNPILFEWFVAKYAGEEDPPKKSREEPINQALIDRLKQRNARSPSDIF